MKPRALLWLLAIAAVGALSWSLASWRNQPPAVPFARVVREPIVSAVSTNGKVEPIEWATARAERSGAVQTISVERGRHVAKDTPLVEIDAADARADLANAQARIETTRAELAVLDKGGKATDLAEVSSGIERARLDLETAQMDYDALKRLEARQAATKFEVLAAKDKVDRAQLQIRSLEQKRTALVVAPDRTAALARLHDADSAARLADQRIKMSVVRSPIDGVVYQFDLKKGAYLNAGDVVASIGRLDRVRVNVYVDEPDMGRVAKGMAVSITWDALPDRQWKGEVDKTPTQIVGLGTRQVGEVVCIIQNPDGDLLPGTNVTADIRTESVASALTIPREAVRRELGQAGVFVLAGDRLEWRKITLGVGNTTRMQVQGLNEGDSIALPTEKPLKEKMIVKPVYP